MSEVWLPLPLSGGKLHLLLLHALVPWCAKDTLRWSGWCRGAWLLLCLGRRDWLWHHVWAALLACVAMADHALWGRGSSHASKHEATSALLRLLLYLRCLLFIIPLDVVIAIIAIAFEEPVTIDVVEATLFGVYASVSILHIYLVSVSVYLSVCKYVTRLNLECSFQMV